MPLQNLMKELREKKAFLDSMTERLEPIHLVLNTSSCPSLADLTRQLDRSRHAVQAIERGLEGIDVTPKRSQQQQQQQQQQQSGQRGGASSLSRSLFGGRKQDKIQDKTRAEQKSRAQQRGVAFQEKGRGRVRGGDVDEDDDDDDDDENSPYARIDTLRKKIFQEKKASGNNRRAENLPLPPGGLNRPLSITEQMFSLPHKSAPSLTSQDLYDQVAEEEEPLPSPFMDYDMVRAIL